MSDNLVSKVTHTLPSRRGIVTVAAAAAGVLAAAATTAQAQMPPELVDKVAAIGRISDPPNTAKIYAPLQEKEPYSGVKVARDLKYGPDPRNVVDVFSPEGAGGARPVLMFVHGGGLVRGSKRAAGSPFYDNIMLFAARNGMVGVNVEYRLAPAHPWPAGAEDMAAAVRWTGEHAAEYGGDPAKVFLMGHSAGATHVSTYVAHTEFHGSKGSGLAGAIFSSAGAYDITKDSPSESRVAYYGSDTSQYGQRSALPGLLKTNVPFMISSAELDPPAIFEQFVMLKEAMCKTERGCVRSLVLPHHGHMSASYSINTTDKELTNQILEFIKTGK
jgi:acetyl esterase/lipase